MTTSVEFPPGPLSKSALVASLADVRQHNAVYAEWKENGKVRSFASDQLHEDCSFLLQVVDKLLAEGVVS